MFEVEKIATGQVYMVYAVSGTMFLVWNNSTEKEHWEWISMEQVRPV